MGKMSIVAAAVVTVMVPAVSAFSRAWSLTNAMMASTHVNEPDLMLSSSVTSGAELAMQECARQFKTEVWNCPVTAFNIDKDRVENNKETAFINAVTSAGVTHTISRNCSQGGLAQCGCQALYGSSGEAAWAWGGCSDNLVFGERVSRQFLDVDRATRQQASLATLHNNQAGRVAVRKTMRTLCKCHGVSGSCATQTCWRQLGDFKQVGNYLKKQYKTAAKVDLSNGILELELKGAAPQPREVSNVMEVRTHTEAAEDAAANSVNAVVRGRRTAKKSSAVSESGKIKKRKLVFLKPSPDYCTLNPQLGFKGVHGRTCEVDPTAADQTEQIRACTSLCTSCGMVARKQVVEVVTSCSCRFEWCCQIKCETCRRQQIRITCTNPAQAAAQAQHARFLDLINNKPGARWRQ